MSYHVFLIVVWSQTLFPGLWLTEVTAESYKVFDVPE